MIKRGQILILIIFILFSTTVLAQENDSLFQAQQITADIDIRGSADIQATSSAYTIDYLIAELHMFPRQTNRQTVLTQTTNPEAALFNDTIRYEWQKPAAQQLNYSLQAQVQTEYYLPRISNKADYPINFDKNIGYLQPTAHIDSDNEAIIMQASQIAEGETDLYLLENKLASWVKENVEYNLSTLTATVDQKASWVLENRYGVCDEITNLFIAMNRALGIPARVASGITYTNSPLFTEKWGNHAWAEIYYPEIGWVPYDVTYGEFGWLDATHIQLMQSEDSNEPSTNFQWMARNIKVSTDKLNVKTSLKGATGQTQKPITIKLDALQEEVGFGSYNLIEATIQNEEDYYMPIMIYLSKVTSTDIITPNPVITAINPGENKTVYWIVKIDKDLQKGYIYTFPFEAYTPEEKTDTFELVAKENELKYSYEEIKQLYEAKQEETSKIYSASITVGCKADKTFVYLNDTSKISCQLKNTGTKILTNMQACILEECQITQLGINQERKLDFLFKPAKLTDSPIIKLNNEDITKTEKINLEVLDKPNLTIQNSTAYQKIKYDEILQVNFTINKESKSDIDELKIRLYKERLQQEWTINNVTSSQNFEIEMQGNKQDSGANNYRIELEWRDRKGTYYTEQKQFNIELTDLTFMQKIKIWLRNVQEAVFER